MNTILEATLAYCDILTYFDSVSNVHFEVALLMSDLQTRFAKLEGSFGFISLIVF